MGFKGVEVLERVGLLHNSIHGYIYFQIFFVPHPQHIEVPEEMKLAMPDP